MTTYAFINALGEAFDLMQSLVYGMLPATLSEPDSAAYLKAYVAAYLREKEILFHLPEILGRQ